MAADSQLNRSQLLDELQRLRAENRLLQKSQALFSCGPVVLFRWRNTEGWPVEQVSQNVDAIFGYTAEPFPGLCVGHH